MYVPTRRSFYYVPTDSGDLMVDCPICNKKIGVINKVTLPDAVICGNCYREWSKLHCQNIYGKPVQKLSLEETRQWSKISLPPLAEVVSAMSKKIETANAFKVTRTSHGFVDFDDDNKMVFIRGGLKLTGGPAEKNPTYLKYEDIIECELIEDSETTMNTGLLGGAAGGLLFGGVGAAVGTVAGKNTKTKVKKISVSIITKVPGKSRVEIPLNNLEIKTKSMLYKQAIEVARDLLAEFKAIIDSNKTQGQTVTHIVENNSVADELMKFKQLLDAGAITQDEFEKQKRRILN